LSAAASTDKRGPGFCRECGKPIEADARFCRFCGKSQSDPATGVAGPARTPAGRQSRPGLEERLQQLFPRHHLQDDFMHVGGIAAFFMALIGFALGFFTPALGSSWLSVNFLLGSIALLLFLSLRESTLSYMRSRGGGPAASEAGGADRYQGRRSTVASEVSTEAATAESSPPGGTRPPAAPR
jgi:zinc ribbon protein